MAALPVGLVKPLDSVLLQQTRPLGSCSAAAATRPGNGPWISDPRRVCSNTRPLRPATVNKIALNPSNFCSKASAPAASGPGTDSTAGPEPTSSRAGGRPRARMTSTAEQPRTPPDSFAPGGRRHRGRRPRAERGLRAGPAGQDRPARPANRRPATAKPAVGATAVVTRCVAGPARGHHAGSPRADAGSRCRSPARPGSRGPLRGTGSMVGVVRVARTRAGRSTRTGAATGRAAVFTRGRPPASGTNAAVPSAAVSWSAPRASRAVAPSVMPTVDRGAERALPASNSPSADGAPSWCRQPRPVSRPIARGKPRRGAATCAAVFRGINGITGPSLRGHVRRSAVGIGKRPGGLCSSRPKRRGGRRSGDEPSSLSGTVE